MARPTKLDLDRVLRLFASLAEGKPIAKAAREAGIGPATAYHWRARGRARDPGFAAVTRVFEAADRARHNAAFAKFAAIPIIRALIQRGL